MDSNYYSDTKRGTTINPADLHNDAAFPSQFLDQFCGLTDTPSLADLSTVDSAVDLTSFSISDLHDQWSPAVKLEPLEAPMDNFFDIGESSQASNTPSPSTDMIFSQANSPGDFLRDHSHVTSRETSTDITSQDAKSSSQERNWKPMFSPPTDLMYIPQTAQPPVETALVHLIPDKTKTRAETQIKVNLILDPLEDRFEHIRFPRKTLAKPKLLASSEERKEIESRGEAVHMDLLLVCATALEKPERKEQALRRARGDEEVPRRDQTKAISELEKDDPAHPQNGGEVLICDGCRERERKRYDRKKKKAEDELEWFKYEADRVVMINEKEYKKFKDLDPVDQKYSSRAKQVEFAMRIACYCRHQEEKSPMGYRVIFTFKDSNDSLIAQHVSEIFQITDDHKNKEAAPESMPRALHIPQQPYVPNQYHNQIVVPQYQYVDGQYTQPAPMSNYSQPPTPVMTNFQTPISPMDSQFSQPTTPNGLPHAHRQAPSFSNSASSVTAPQFPRPQPHTRYDVPMMSPTGQFPAEPTYLTRPMSMENFNFNFNPSYQYAHNGFASAPPSAVSTPINLSRPASPTWEQGPTKKKMVSSTIFYYVDDD